MKQNIVFLLGLVTLFSGCSVTTPIKKPLSVEDNVTHTRILENKETFSVQAIAKNDVDVIENVFLNELDLENNTNTETLIESLDAFPWEKEALQKVYASYEQIWENAQKKEFNKILEEDKYLSICGDRRYVDNLKFIDEPAKQDILYSILLLKYSNNLKSGCLEWVSSDGQVKNENSTEQIRSNYLLSMVPKGVLINKLLLSYGLKNREFIEAVQHYKSLEMSSLDPNELKVERLKVEQYKIFEEQPDYN